MGFSRQEYWNELPFPFPGDLPNPVIEPTSLALAGGFFFVCFVFTVSDLVFIVGSLYLILPKSLGVQGWKTHSPLLMHA